VANNIEEHPVVQGWEELSNIERHDARLKPLGPARPDEVGPTEVLKIRKKH